MVDAFTTVPFTGNKSGVLYPAADLDEQTMLALAGELGASESAFIVSFDHDAATVEIRFFTSKVEMEVCTHATVAAFHVLATRYGLGAGTYHMKGRKAGYTVRLEAGGVHPTITVVQRDNKMVRLLSEAERQKLAVALGLDPEGPSPIGDALIYRAATARTLAELSDRKTLNALTPNNALLKALGQSLGVPGFYCYTYDGSDQHIRAHCRMFSPGTGVDEDPVTGNAASALALYERSIALIADKETVRYAQGEQMGRGEVVTVTVDGEHALISGQAVTVWEGSILL